MKKMKITPILILNILSLVASLLLLIGSHTWFRGCENEEMNCHNAAILVRTVSYFALALSLLKLGLPQKQAKGGIAIGLFGFALLALLVPNALIELCMMDSMACRSALAPWSLVFGIILMAISLCEIFLSLKKERP